MNLPSTSYVAESKSGKLSSDRRSKDSRRSPCEHQHQQPSPPTHTNSNPEIKSSSDMESVYSDAGDTFASTRPCSSNGQDSEGSVSCQPRRTDGNSRDFIMRRFLPAAQAMATEASSSNATSSSASSHPPSDQRSNRNTTVVTNATLPPLPANKSRFVQEVRQDVRENSDNEGDEIRACGIPLKLGKLTLGNLKYSFWSTSRSKSPREANANTNTNTNTSSHHHHKKAPADGSGVSENSDDLFWSDEEYVENAELRKSKPPIPAAPTERERLSELKNGIQERESFRKLEATKFSKAAAAMDGLAQARGAAPARLHSMETVHTPDHKGFLGLPRNPSTTSHSGSGKGGPPDAADRERAARQVDRLGARLTRMISKTNYVDARSNARVNEHDEVDGSGSQGPPASSSGGGVGDSMAEQPQQLRPKGKWVDRVAVIGGSLRPPPSPKSPSESWLCNTLPPSRFLEVKKLSSRKPLGSYIPIKPPLKPQPSREEVPSRLRQSCSLKEHLQGTRQIVSSTVQAV